MTLVKRPSWILPVIVSTQFAGGSPWFSGNAVLETLQRQWSMGSESLGYLTSAVQLGFILGTLCFAYFAVSDRHSPRVVFFVCSLLGAFSNLLIFLVAEGFYSMLLFRFLTGFFLAGIYPVGMKIAAGWYQEGLGKAMGFLIGALVAGTAFPHLIKGMGATLPWQAVIITTSAFSAAGGLLMLLLVPNGPYMKKGNSLNGQALQILLRSRPVRAAAIGYFGHMWELYTFWAFVPVVLGAYLAAHAGSSLNVSLWTFCIMAS
ncbi:MAG: MFS transporter, partial [Planctomycetota bacterium]